MDIRDSVPEVATELAEDGGSRIGGERNPQGRVKAVQGFDQPEICDLNQVIELLWRTSISKRQRSREGEESATELLLQRWIVALCVAT